MDDDSPTLKHHASLRTTRWSLVQRAANGAGQALDEWAGASWYPLYTWAS